MSRYIGSEHFEYKFKVTDVINLINKLKNPSIFRGVFYYYQSNQTYSIVINGEREGVP